MEKKHQYAMLGAIVHIVNGDWASLVYDLTEMDVIRPGTNIRRFTMVASISLIILNYTCIWFLLPSREWCLPQTIASDNLTF